MGGIAGLPLALCRRRSEEQGMNKDKQISETALVTGSENGATDERPPPDKRGGMIIAVVFLAALTLLMLANL